MRFFDLKPGITLPALRVRSVALMTNGDVRLYYDDDETTIAKDVEPTMTPKQLDDAAATLQKTVPEIRPDSSLAAANHQNFMSNQKRLERDMASGPGSNKPTTRERK